MRKILCLEDVVQAALDSHSATKYHIMPGLVATYYPGSPTSPASVDVTPGVNDVRIDSATGSTVSEPWTLIPAVPLLFLKVGPFIIAGPCAAGDEVVLLGFDLDPTNFLQSGTVSDPAEIRRHSGSYWVAIPGSLSNPKAFKDGTVIGTQLVLGVDGGQDQIRFPNDGTIQLGATGGDFVALASLVSAQLTDIKAALAGLQTASIPSGWTAPAGTAGGPCTPTAPAPVAVTSTSPYSTVGNVASTLIQAQ